MNLVSHSTLCINMAKARRDKLTLKEKTGFYCERRLSDTDEKLMTAQDSVRVAVVRGSIQTAENFNKCKINVFILLIIFSAN